MKRTLIALLMALGFGVLSLDSTAGEKTTESPRFFGQDDVHAVFQVMKSPELLPQLDMEVSQYEALSKTMTDYLAGKALHRDQGALSEEGCFSYWPEHSEHLYVEEGQTATVEDLLASADEVLHARVLSSSPGFLETRLGTRLELKILDSCGADPQEDRRGEVTSTFLLTSDLMIGDERICRDRAGFYIPAVGDEVLLLGRKLAKGLFGAANYFKVQGEWIQPQPYPFLEERGRVRLNMADGCSK